MDVLTAISLLLALATGMLVGLGVAAWRNAAVAPPSRELEARAADQAVLSNGMERLGSQLQDLAAQRVAWQATLAQQVSDMRHTTDLLRRETSTLSTALRRPQVRGRWGELHLRRAVELAGLVARCDFDEQVTLTSDTGAPLRPDVVVHLAGGKQVVVDAKVPLDAFLDVTECEEDDERAAHLARHARQFRHHVETLAQKSYWRALPASPEFVVLFVPGESFLSAALEADPLLIEYAAERKVVLATPTTLIALLRTVAYGWTQETLADKAREVHRLGQELLDRLATMTGHLDKMGRSMTGAITAYNQAVGSLETRVLVSARKLADLSVSDQELPGPRPVEVATRAPSTLELTEDERAGVLRSGVHAAGPEPGVASQTPS